MLETTLERVPLLRLRHNLIDRPWDDEGIEWYRRIMTSLGDKAVGEKLQQRYLRLSFHLQIYNLAEFDREDSQGSSALRAVFCDYILVFGEAEF